MDRDKESPLYRYGICIHGYFREFHESDLVKIYTSIYVYLK